MTTRPIQSPANTNSHPECWATPAFDAAPIPMLIVDADGLVVGANLEAQRAFGRCRSVVGIDMEMLTASEDRVAMRDALALVRAAPVTQPPMRHVMTGLRDTGERFPIELSFGRLDATDTSMAIAVIRDISEQRHSEVRHTAAAAAAHDATARLEAMLECAPAFIIAFNRSGTIDFINRTLAHYVKSDVVGMNWLSFFGPDQRAVMVGKLEAVYATELPQLFETHTPGPDGRPVFFDTQIAPIRSAGEIVGAVMVSQDMTERKRTQAELLANRHMALLGTLAAGVAHEINTPIQFVRDSIQFLSEAVTDLITLIDTLQRLRRDALAGTALGPVVEAAAQAEETADLPYLRENLPSAFETCLDGMNKIAKIVRSLKDFAHPADEDKSPTDLNRVIQTALTIATGEYKLVADLETHFEELPLITCHAAEISQVVLNVVVNAAHAIGEVVNGTTRRGLITVSTHYEGDAAVVRISDTGCGIPDAIKSRIFDPFFTTKEVGKGTGQGLSIAWSMVKERQGGDITFETEVGRGTTFTIRIPNEVTAYSAPQMSTPNSMP